MELQAIAAVTALAAFGQFASTYLAAPQRPSSTLTKSVVSILIANPSQSPRINRPVTELLSFQSRM